ncbi:D-amino acid aminotransferase [Campylobacter sp. RM9344]|uniref:branched-chain-amino-acid transaminase n=1 Tax=Campylobacter californiensis TaxID=1032243 RepID=A0AAW3ZR37_9BACT|nr:MULTISPECIES: D-amino acid aminotransferase [unclassified Campylobacter]MBE2983799.1 D-amino acid aminotransferase [Campylobacter sp. RM6883]MBE2985637.1 D-amino acid aminotransferase [Campylobacter sp. RM12919]MBE2987334.1 D-amino acid aminotransferase [Campylobacter sp. RM12920]MBE2994337.1 D-amino acid aminotransferase [Campylobacter sp. RM6913]MBE3022203.1 D-amino acid aminotransferase [Campylobacter sp. 7477a]MBE3028645.1 D-amino acid aminotransferase [Campylobacter sp. RM9344]
MAGSNMEIVFLNGEFCKASEAKVSAFDRGFVFGDGIYEVVPVINSRLVDREDFWLRFERSLKEIELKLPYNKEKFEEILYEIITKNNLKEGGVYMQITRGAAPRDFYFIENLTPSVFVFCYEAEILSNPLATTGIEVASVDDIRWKRRDIKSISLLAQCYAKNEAHKKGAHEGFMVEDGFVTEGCSSSAFIIKDGVLITKPLSNEILPGIRRKRLLRLADQAGLKVEQRKFSMSEVYEADEVFISAATLILLPVIKADGRAINGGKIGKFSMALRELYVQEFLKEALK